MMHSEDAAQEPPPKPSLRPGVGVISSGMNSTGNKRNTAEQGHGSTLCDETTQKDEGTITTSGFKTDNKKLHGTNKQLNALNETVSPVKEPQPDESEPEKLLQESPLCSNSGGGLKEFFKSKIDAAVNHSGHLSGNNLLCTNANNQEPPAKKRAFGSSSHPDPKGLKEDQDRAVKSCSEEIPLESSEDEDEDLCKEGGCHSDTRTKRLTLSQHKCEESRKTTLTEETSKIRELKSAKKQILAALNEKIVTVIVKQPNSDANKCEKELGPNRSGVLKESCKIDISVNKPVCCNLTNNLPHFSGIINEEKAASSNANETPIHPSLKQLKEDQNEGKKTINSSMRSNIVDSKAQLNIGQDGVPKDGGYGVIEDKEKKPLHTCKHCNFNNVDIQRVFDHYRDCHPYIRFTTQYIQDPGDDGASFRCLQCPVEFSSVAALQKHRAVNHTESPDFLKLQTHKLNLWFKCFECTFTSTAVEDLKRHHKEQHPTLKVDNMLLYNPFLETRCDEGENEKEFFYRCSHCSFKHRSAVVIHVHYRKTHPTVNISIDKIKKSFCPASSRILPTYTKLVDKSQKKNDSQIQMGSKGGSTKPNEDKSQEKDADSPVEMESKGGNGKPSLIVSEKEESEKLENVSSSSVSGLHQKRDPYPAGIFDIMKYKCDLENQIDESEAGSSKCDVSDHLDNLAEPEEERLSQQGNKLCTTDLYYCHICNYGNQSVRGVRIHQARYHDNQYDMKDVLDHSASIRSQLRTSKPERKDSSLNFDLPLPILMEGEEKMFFCYICNFRGPSIDRVTQHFKRNHYDISVDEKLISLYTAHVLQHAAQPKVSVDLSFSCDQCSFGSQSLYNLRKHALKCHNEQLSFQSILRTHFKKGKIQAGYYCNFCVSRHENATALHDHYRTQHTHVKSIPSVRFMERNLFVDSENSPKRKSTETSQNVLGSTDEPLSYPCRACSFKASTVEEVTDHYRSVHPWSVKEDGSVPSITNRKKLAVPKSDKKKIEPVETSAAPSQPVESVDSGEAVLSQVFVQCPYCATRFHVFRDFKAHCELEHGDLEKEEKVKRQMHVFKCQHCPYVNGNFHLIAMHCQMKHNDLQSITTRLLINESHLDKLLKSKEGFKISKIKGFICDICSQIHLSQDWLNKHNKSKHSKTAEAESTKVSPVVKKPAVKSRFFQKAFSNVFGKSLRCHQCDHRASTKVGLDRHMRIVHKNGPVSNVHDRIFKCEMCPKIYTSKKYLLNHCRVVHETEGILEYNPSDKGDVQNNSSDKLAECTAVTKKTVYKCLRCPYVHVSYCGTLVHCVKIHKGVQPKADNLTTYEVLESNFVNYENGNCKKGYICKKCLQIHSSMKALNSHTLKHRHEVGQDDPLSSENIESLQSPLLDNEIQLSPGGSQPQPRHSQMQSAEPNEDDKFVYKCPHCPYVNSRPHGMLTHCQMVHPDLTVTIRKLNTQKVSESNFVKSAKEKGYMCTVCSLIHVSFRKLKLHNETHQCQDSKNDEGLENKSIGMEVELQPDFGYRCALCTYSTMMKMRMAFHYNTQHGKEAFLKYFSEVMKQPLPSNVDAHNDTEEDQSKRSVYKCPCCPYLHVRPHGTLTHCQMIHPSLTVSSDRLEVIEVLISDFASSASGKYSKAKGYQCSMCPQIHISMKKLRRHKDTHQLKKEDESLLKPTSEIQASQMSHQPSDPGSDSNLASHYTPQPVNPQSEDKPRPYQCNICSYAAHFRQNLLFHYKKTHKLDSFNTRRLLQQYNKRKPDKQFLAQLSEKAPFKCIKCPNMHFESAESLISHYNSFHSLQGKKDFSVMYISHILQKNTWMFKCLHCRKSIIGLDKLFEHLEEHRETHQSGQAITEEARSELCRDESSSSQLSPKKEAEIHPATSPPSSSTPVAQVENNSNLGIKKFLCPQCPRKFSSLLGLRNHGLSHKSKKIRKSRWRLNFEKFVGFKKESTKPHVCLLCAYRSTNAYHLQIHVLKTHSDMIKQSRHEDQPHDGQMPQSLSPADVAEPDKEDQEAASEAATPRSSSPRNTVEEKDHNEPENSKYSCRFCSRTFMSRKGMLTHESSHKAFKAFKGQDNLTSSRQKDIFEQHFSIKEGRAKPYHCRLCPYRTSVLSLVRCHFLKKHQARRGDGIKQDDTDIPSKEQEPLESSEEHNSLSEPEGEPRTAAVSYKEHPDVQRQLNHLRLIAQTKNAVKVNVEGVMAQGALLHCEYCDFNSAHLASIRRHYNNRHAKKLQKCKDCEFFSASRETMEMHAKVNHSEDGLETAASRIHRCPFCLYQCTDKNNMIDHIVLHREKRSIPIEVTRPKLSRYLQGLVFRCHKCTYTTGSSENLDAHMSKHVLQLYKCALCYFDCSQPGELQKHLCDKHQVLRNHDLVAQLKSPPPVGRPDSGLCSSRTVKEDHSPEEVEMDDSDQEDKGLEQIKRLEKRKILERKTQEVVENDILRNILQLDQESVWKHRRSMEEELLKRENTGLQESCLEKVKQEVTNTFPEFSGSVTQLKEEQAFKGTDRREERLDDECLQKEVLKHLKEDPDAEGGNETQEQAGDIIQTDTSLLIASVSGGDDPSLCLEKMSFRCDLCGRNLSSVSDLESHTKRHRL